MTFVVAASEKGTGEANENHRVDNSFPRLVFVHFFPLFLLFSAFFRHNFSYITGVRQPRSARPEVRRVLHSAATELRRQP